MAVYYLPVACAFLGLLAAFGRDRKLDVVASTLIAIVVGLLAGLRWNSDVDYEPYAEMFADVPRLSDWTVDEMRELYGEPGYLVVNSIVKTLGGAFFIVSALCAFISISLKWFFFRKCCQFAALALSLYLCLHFLTIEFIQIRWAVATSFLLIAFYLLQSSRNVAAVLSFLVAIGFHYFSVFYLPIALASRLSGHRRFYLMVLTSFAIGLLSSSIDLSPLLGRMEGNSDAYIVTRTLRYLADPTSGLGILSFLKLLAYPAVYAGLSLISNHGRPSMGTLEDFLFKVGLASISATFLLSFVPIFHFRSAVIADALGLCLVLNKLASIENHSVRILGSLGMTMAYVTWYWMDLSNQTGAEFILVYRSWLAD